MIDEQWQWVRYRNILSRIEVNMNYLSNYSARGVGLYGVQASELGLEGLMG